MLKSFLNGQPFILSLLYLINHHIGPIQHWFLIFFHFNVNIWTSYGLLGLGFLPLLSHLNLHIPSTLFLNLGTNSVLLKVTSFTLLRAQDGLQSF
jgi:hypothetical protein